MSCTAITDIVVRESGRYLDDVLRRRTFATSPWMRLIKRGTFPRGLGETINVLSYERTAPTEAEPAWTTVAVNDGAEGGACLTPATKLSVGSTTRNFNLARRVLEGPDFCAEELRTPFAIMQQLNAIVDQLVNYVKLEWEIRDRHEYFRLVKRKVVVDGCPPTESNTSATTYPAVCPTAQLSIGILNRYKAKLLRDGAGEFALGLENNMPIFTVIASMETIDLLLKSNDARRQDLRWGAPNVLLAPFGVDRSYLGFYFLNDPYPRRFSCAGGVYTEIPAFIENAASKGDKAEINPTYETALYEESFIFSPSVFTQLIPEPVVNPAPKFRFNALNYTGQWRVINGFDRICNPDENILYHRGILAAGSMPVHPEHGVAFVHLRCDPSCELTTTCPTS